jgi:hypothetical protein
MDSSILQSADGQSAGTRSCRSSWTGCRLRTWFWKDGVRDVEAQDIWQKTCQYLYLPRLKDSHVFQATLADGAGSRDYFGLAMGKRDDKYLSFSFGGRPAIYLDETLIIEPKVAAEYEAAIKGAEEAKVPGVDGVAPTSPTATPQPNGPGVPGAPQTARSTKKRFFGTTGLDPILAKKEFADVVDEVVQQFTTKVGSEVTITVEVQARSAAGFDEGVQRAVRENCKTLKFSSFDFEAED